MCNLNVSKFVTSSTIIIEAMAKKLTPYSQVLLAHRLFSGTLFAQEFLKKYIFSGVQIGNTHHQVEPLHPGIKDTSPSEEKEVLDLHASIDLKLREKLQLNIFNLSKT